MLSILLLVLVPVFFIAILLVFQPKLKIKKQKSILNLDLKLKQYGGKPMFTKANIAKARAAVAKARAKDNEDPYAWIRPMYIVDIFRKFWLTR